MSEFEHAGLTIDVSKGYVEMVHCLNCRWFDSIYIPFGEKKTDYLDGKKCERCKCVGVLY